MSNFIQAGANDRFKSAGGGEEQDCAGLPVHWSNIKDGKCPKCGKKYVIACTDDYEDDSIAYLVEDE